MAKFQNDKILITTPKGQMVQRQYTKGKNVGKVYTRIEWNPEFGDKYTALFSESQKFLDNEVLRSTAPYVPLQTGMLMQSGTLGTVIGSGEVIYSSPYAASQYYNTQQSRIYDAQRGGMWFERSKADHKDAWIRGVKKIAGGG